MSRNLANRGSIRIFLLILIDEKRFFPIFIANFHCELNPYPLLIRKSAKVTKNVVDKCFASGFFFQISRRKKKL